LTFKTQLMPGDLVELLPSNNRNRQLRSQEKKYIWEVIKICPTICFANRLGYLIANGDHTRWVERDEVSLYEYNENARKDNV